MGVAVCTMPECAYWLCWAIHELHVFIVMHTHSTWPEVMPIKSMTSEKSISVLRSIFSRNGLPEQIVSDNGPQYTSDELRLFIKKNGIKHFMWVPHHQATNGLTEQFVQPFKKSINAMVKDDISLQHKVDNFFFVYWNSVHVTKNQTSAMLFMNRRLRSHIDLLKPNLWTEVQNKQFTKMTSKASRSFDTGQQVLAHDCWENKWTSRWTVTRAGPLRYEVNVGDHTWRHDVGLDAQTKNTPEHSGSNKMDTVCSPDLSLDSGHDSNRSTTPATEKVPLEKNPHATPQVQRCHSERTGRHPKEWIYKELT